MKLTPYEVVKQHYTLPFELYPEFQVPAVNELAELEKIGCYLDIGCGKTATSTVIVLFKMIVQGVQHCVCHMPPILIDRWAHWLAQIKPQPSVTVYRGSPAERAKIKLDGKFILMSTQIFKKDYERLFCELGHRSLAVLVDEATSVKNVGSDNYKKTRDFSAGQHLLLLTGTPLSTPMDGYAFVKFTSPTIYRNLNQFENIHVASRDFFGNVTGWKNLDLLKENLKRNSVRVLKTEALKHLPAVIYDPMFYRLDTAHMRLYKTLAEEQLLPLKDGGKIDATQATKLLHALGQIVVNYDHFADDPKCVSKTIELIEQVVEELDGRKLVVFANYRMTNRKLIQLLQHRGAVGAFGDLSQKQQQANIAQFIEDPACQVFVGQPTSVGYGVDGLQHVCHDVLFAEPTTLTKDFYQALGRIWRDGQTEKVHVRIAVAEGTLQVRKLNQLLDNDSLLAKVQTTYADLRAEIFGE